MGALIFPTFNSVGSGASLLVPVLAILSPLRIDTYLQKEDNNNTDSFHSLIQ